MEDLTYASCVERGLVLIKVAAGAEHRGEVLDLAGIFRASAIDVSEKSITLAVTGDPGKTRAFQRTINKFGVLAVARTGKARSACFFGVIDALLCRCSALWMDANDCRGVKLHSCRCGWRVICLLPMLLLLLRCLRICSVFVRPAFPLRRPPTRLKTRPPPHAPRSSLSREKRPTTRSGGRA